MMWKFLVPVFVGLNLLSGIAVSAAPADSQTIRRGGCIVIPDTIRGKLIQELVEDNDADQLEGPYQIRLPIAKVKLLWTVKSGRQSYRLDFVRNLILRQGLPHNLVGHNVVVTGVISGDAMVVTEIKADGEATVQVTGQLQLDPTEILRPYQVCWYIEAGGQHYYLDLAGNKELAKQVLAAKGSVIVAGELEVSGRWFIVHVRSLKSAETKSGLTLEKRG